MVATKSLLEGKWALMFLLLTLCPIWTYAQRDLILLRDGSDRKVKIVMVNSENTVFSANESSSREVIPNKDVYMIKYDKRGNVFFTEDGERITGDGDGKIPSNATAIYLLKGEEIIGYNVEMDTAKVSFTISKKKGKDVLSINKSEIFLISYPDKTKEMLNDFETIKRVKEEALAEKRRQEEEARLAELRSRYPKDASIKTIKNNTIKVSLLSETEDVITYKRKEQEKGPIYHMNRTNIKEIMFND
jgi:hypothetical protein